MLQIQSLVDVGSIYVKYAWRYRVAANYIQLVDNNQNKGETMYIDGRPKASGNIVGFINST
jgi:hypothetical protein